MTNSHWRESRDLIQMCVSGQDPALMPRVKKNGIVRRPKCCLTKLPWDVWECWNVAKKVKMLGALIAEQQLPPCLTHGAHPSVRALKLSFTLRLSFEQNVMINSVAVVLEYAMRVHGNLDFVSDSWTVGDILLVLAAHLGQQVWLVSCAVGEVCPFGVLRLRITNNKNQD